MRSSFLIFLVVSCLSVTAAKFQAFLHYVKSLPIEQRQAKADSFLRVNRAFPLIESDTIVNFIWAGKADNVVIVGDFTSWDPGRFTMTNLQGTILWYYTLAFKNDARLDYKFIINGETWITDPKNPDVCIGGYGPNSEVHMPAYHYPPEVNYSRDIPHGVIRDTIIHSASLSDNRTITIYLPHDFAKDKMDWPVIVFHDGEDYLKF